MKKLRWVGVCLMITSLLLAGCMEKGDPEHVGDEELIELAGDFMNRLNAEEYERATELFNDTMQGQLTAADLEEIWLDISGHLGNLNSYEYHSSEEKDGYEIIYMDGHFEEVELRYKITFDAEQRIAEFFIS